MKTVDDGVSRQATTAQGVDRESAEIDMRHIVESGAALLWVGRPDGTRRWVGGALAKFTGLPMQALAGTRWLEAVHPQDAARCAAIDALCLAEDRRFTLDYRLRRHDGRHVWIMDSATPCHDAAGKFHGHVGMCVDIDERRHLEDDMAERVRKMRAAGRG